MPPAASFARTLAHTAETLIVALAGGTAFTLAGFPAGLISGSVLAVAAAALLGRTRFACRSRWRGSAMC
jgi:uncharacterized membrane protein AbrB (regulator of aidB expression)